MLRLSAGTYADLFFLICGDCHRKTLNEYLGAHTMRVRCPGCRQSQTFKVEPHYWRGLPL